MPLHLDTDERIFLFTARGDDYVDINQERYTSSIIVQPEKLHPSWTHTDFTQLGPADFELLADINLGILLLGTGNRLRFPEATLLRPLIESGVGVEVMDIAAACHTYNILANEGRQVTAALVFDKPE